MSLRARFPRLASVLLAAAASLALAGCGDSATPSAGAQQATATEAAEPGTSAAADGEPTAAVDEIDDVCAALPLEAVNQTTSAFGGPVITEKTPQDGGCLLTAADAQYLVSVTTQSVDEVVAGREAFDVSAGARTVTVDDDRTWIQECGARTCVTQVIGGGDLVNVVDLISLMDPVADALTR